MKRRSFIRACAAAIHATIVAALAIPGAAFLLSPLRRREGKAPRTSYTRVASLDALVAGRPSLVPVRARRRDTFTRYPTARIGQVWLMLEPGLESEPEPESESESESASKPEPAPEPEREFKAAPESASEPESTSEPESEPTPRPASESEPEGGHGHGNRAGDKGGADPTVRAWQSICPHLGCGIGFSAQRALFTCPCHASVFGLDGRRLSGPAPRGMDPLPVRLTPPDDTGRRWVEVEYDTFRAGVSARNPIT